VPPSRLPDDRFDGGSLRVDFSQGDPRARMWRNPRGSEYQPRVTYWRGQDSRDAGLLKLEFSVPKLLGLGLDNPSPDDVAAALDIATEFVRVYLSDDLPHVGAWKCQRVDYAYNWAVGDLLPAYLATFSRLQCRTYQRHPFGDAGVVWKSRSNTGRWVKFYDKGKEVGVDVAGVLRFEVSNYRDAVRYMASAWFGCERSVSELVRPGRALYVMALHFDLLGLGEQTYGYEQHLLFRLRDAFGVRGVARAHYMLTIISEYGTGSYRDDVMLVSKSTFYSWRKRLIKHGFLCVRDDGSATIAHHDLPPLVLPLEAITKTRISSKNLDRLSAAPPLSIKKIWQKMAPGLGVKPGVRASEYLLRLVA
jgi:hypothetical protein